MAKAKKQSKTKSLNALRKSVSAKLQLASASAFKVDAGKVKKMASAVIAELKHAHHGVRDLIVMWKGERPETLEALKEQIKAQCKAWLKEEGRRINPQSVYNYQSDLLAACNGYMAYAAMSKSAAAHFDAKHKSMTGYHALIKFLRDTKRGKSNKPDASAKQKRIQSGWKNKPRDMMKQAKDVLRYAPTDNLLALIDFAEALVKARKQGNVSKLAARKAA